LLKDYQLKLHINPDVIPVQQPLRRIPFHTKPKVSNELTRLLSLDVIEKVQGPTTWLSLIVAGQEKYVYASICAKQTLRERNVIPKIEDILTELHSARIFSKIDLREGYHQIILDEQSRHHNLRDT